MRMFQDFLILELEGRLDMLPLKPIEQQILNDEHFSDAKAILFDLSQLRYISSSGIRSLLDIQKTLSRNEKPMGLLSVPPSIKQIFDILGLKSIFFFSKDLDEASKYL